MDESYSNQPPVQPNRVELLSGGLAGVAGGLERLKSDQVSGVKLVVRPQDTSVGLLMRMTR